MPKPVARAVAFAIAAFVVLLLADLLLFGVFQVGPAPEHRYEVMGAHAAFHVAALVLSAAGASLGFFLQRQALPSFLVAFALGAAFGLVSVLVAADMLMLAGIYAALAWVLLGSMGSALASRLISRPWQRDKLPADGSTL